jgi:hypothetical protein
VSKGGESVLHKPIVIIGPPRSGTTLLMRVLAAHRRLAVLSEPRLTWRYGNDRRSDLLRPEHARPEVCAHVREAFAAELRRQGGERIVEKTPSNALRPAFVEAVLPGCLFLNILRHPYEAVLSIRDAWDRRGHGVRAVRRGRWQARLREISPRQVPRSALELLRRLAPAGLGRPEWGPRLPGMQALLRELSLLEVACLQWRMCAEASVHHGRRLPAERYLELRLEGLGPGSLARILAFCELDDDPAVREAFAGEFDAHKASHRRETAPAEDLATIRDWVEPTMRWLGYEP